MKFKADKWILGINLMPLRIGGSSGGLNYHGPGAGKRNSSAWAMGRGPRAFSKKAITINR